MFRDRYGRTWITAAALYKYFGVQVTEWKKYFYDYEWCCKWL